MLAGGNTVHHCLCNTFVFCTTSLFLLNKAEITMCSPTMLYSFNPALIDKSGLLPYQRKLLLCKEFAINRVINIIIVDNSFQYLLNHRFRLGEAILFSTLWDNKRCLTGLFTNSSFQVVKNTIT